MATELQKTKKTDQGSNPKPTKNFKSEIVDLTNEEEATTQENLCFEEKCGKKSVYECACCHKFMCENHKLKCSSCGIIVHNSEDDVFFCYNTCVVCEKEYCDLCRITEEKEVKCKVCKVDYWETCNRCIAKSNFSSTKCEKCENRKCSTHKFECCKEAREYVESLEGKTCFEEDCTSKVEHECSECDNFMCDEHMIECESCDKPIHYSEDDYLCARQCENCSNQFCSECILLDDVDCSICAESNLTYCKGCAATENNSGGKCRDCGKYMCNEHLYECCDESEKARSENGGVEGWYEKDFETRYVKVE